MSDASVNTFFYVFMGIFVEGNTYEHMWWDVLVQPFLNLIDEFSPVSIFPSHPLEARSAHLIAACSEEHELVVHISNVLRRLDDGNDIAALRFVSSIFVDQVVPGMTLREMVELKCIARQIILLNRFVAVEYGQHVVTLLDFSFIHSERHDLTSGHFLFRGPCDKVFTVFL